MSSPLKPAFRPRSFVVRLCAETASACRDIESLVSTAFGVPLNDMRRLSRGSPAAAFARQVAMYLAHIELGMSMTLVGGHFSRHRATVCHACRRVEDCRDDPVLDMALFYLAIAIAGHRSVLTSVPAK